MDVLHAQALLMSTRRRQQAREHESNEEGEERRAAVVHPVTGQEGGGTLPQGGEGVGTPAEGAADAATTPGRLAAIVGRISGRVTGETPAGTTADANPFSQDQQAAISDIVKKALAESLPALLARRGDAQAPAAESAVEEDARDRPRGHQDFNGLAHHQGESVSELEYVPDLGVNNPHALPVHTGGDTLLRPQRYNMHRDSTFDSLKSKPKGTLFKEYTVLEPSLRYLKNCTEYLRELTDEADAGKITADEIALHTERVYNSVSGVYDMLNRHVGLIHLRARYGDNPTAREKAKLEHIEDVLTEEDFLPASLDDRIRDIAKDFDASYDKQKQIALAKKAAGATTPRGDDDEPGGGKESRRAKAKRLEAERKTAEAKKAEVAKGNSK